MNHTDTRNLKLVIALTIMIILLLIYLPSPAFSQEGSPPNKLQNLIVNGGFEGGFQPDFGIGYGWGGFSNGNAVVGWMFDSWSPVVATGDYAQSIEIKDALDSDRYAGIYQTVSVVPGQQYKLTVKGLIRSDEGSIEESNYGYRLQYAIDQDGGTAWELLEPDAWAEFPWDEQPLADPEKQNYKYNDYETTITAEGDKLTLFIRGWKKWINKGTGLFNLDEVSLVGPAPEGFQAPIAQAASVGGNIDQNNNDAGDALSTNSASSTETESSMDSEAVIKTESSENSMDDEALAEAEPQRDSTASSPGQSQTLAGSSAQANRTTQNNGTIDQSGSEADESIAQLPVSGLGRDDSLYYVMVVGILVLLVLFAGAVKATVQQRGIME